MTPSITRTTRPTIPAPRPATPLPSAPTAAVCGMCGGAGGMWVTNDGQSPGKSPSRWVPCTGCKGTGEK